MKFEKPSFEKIVKSVKKTVAMGTVMGASFLGSASQSEGAEKSKADPKEASRTEQSGSKEQKIDSAFINNFVREMREKTLKAALKESDKISFEGIINEIENFYTKIDFQENLQEEDKKTLEKAGTSIADIVMKIAERINIKIKAVQEENVLPTKYKEAVLTELKRVKGNADKIIQKLTPQEKK